MSPATHAAMSPGPLRRALELHRRGEFAEAQAAYEAVLATHPRHAGALMGLGLIALSRHDPAQAVARLEEARRIAPRDPAVLNNLGLALAAAGRDGEAISAWRRALTIEPRFADALVNLANADAASGRRESAILRYRAALAVDARSASAAANLGGLLVAGRAYTEAIRWLRHAAELDPANADVRVNLGRAWAECGRARDARTSFESALRIRPGDRVAASNLLLALHYCDDVDAAAIARAHRDWARTQEPNGPRPRPPVRPGRPGRFRVGLLSGDFNDHAVMRFLSPLLERHDRERVELRCYYTGRREDACTASARAWAGAFVAAADLGDTQLAQRMLEDDLDILVDLSGHSAGGRPGLLALRAAPLQATWLGYLGTTGLASVDFRLTDAVADPPGLTEELHAERLWRLPVMWCYRARADSPATSPAPCMRTGWVTFGSTNNPAKLSDATLSLWAGILESVPGCRLLIHAHDDPTCRERITTALGANAVASGRVAYFGREGATDYLKRYGDIDIVLDATPYAGGATTCDALWMGVPVVSLCGDRPFSRTGASILHAAGLARWVANDREGYMGIARSLASDLAVLASLRDSLRATVAASRLCDEGAMVEDFTAALPAMWATAALAPRGGP